VLDILRLLHDAPKSKSSVIIDATDAFVNAAAGVLLLAVTLTLRRSKTKRNGKSTFGRQ
jgi:hypothetical protein